MFSIADFRSPESPLQNGVLIYRYFLLCLKLLFYFKTFTFRGVFTKSHLNAHLCDLFVQNLVASKIHKPVHRACMWDIIGVNIKETGSYDGDSHRVLCLPHVGSSFSDDVFEDIPTSMNILVLRDNWICNFNSIIFKNHNNLIELYLSHNALTKLDISSFKGLENLKYLNLCKNKINSIEPNTFQDLKNLKYLDLSFNKLGPHLAQNLFSGLTSLECLCVEKNEISSISPKSFHGLENLKTLLFNLNKVSTIDAVETGLSAQG